MIATTVTVTAGKRDNIKIDLRISNIHQEGMVVSHRGATQVLDKSWCSVLVQKKCTPDVEDKSQGIRNGLRIDGDSQSMVPNSCKMESNPRQLSLDIHGCSEASIKIHRGKYHA